MKNVMTSLLVASGLLFTGVAFAGPGYHGGEDGQCANAGEKMEIRRDKMAERLELTDAQRQQFDAVMDEMKAKKMDLRSQDLDPEARHAEMRALGDETHERVAEFLDADQLAEFDEMRAQRRAKMEARHGKMQAHKAEVEARLDLTDAQKPQFEAIMQEHIMAKRALVMEAKAQGEHPDRSEMKALGQAADQKLSAILTDAQMDTWAEIKAERRAQRHGAKGKRGGHGQF